MLVNDIKKGTWGVMHNGWACQFMDNTKGIARVLDVYGWEHEMGSTYVWEIAYVYPLSRDMTHAEFIECCGGHGTERLAPEAVELSPAQTKQSKPIRAFGF